MPRGRKSKYERISKKLDKIKEYARNGATNKEIAGILGISEETFYQYCNKYPEFSEAIIYEKTAADLEIVGSMYQRAKGYEFVEEHIEYTPGTGDKAVTQINSVKKIKKHIPANVTAAAIWLFNRRKLFWARNQAEVPDTPLKLPEFDKMTDEELITAIEQGVARYEQD